VLKLILASAAAMPLAAGATVAATGIAWVDVREGGPNGTRIIVPVPLLAAEVAASFAPIPDLRAEMGEAREHLGTARKMLDALRDAPDGELVRVEEKDETVVIAKEGDTLRVHVSGRDEDVTVNVPLESAAQVIRPDGRIDPAAAVRGLRHARFQTLVEVRDGDDHVKISLW
jgi:hypothetical protein